ncbi:EF-hand domain-containing protein [Streptomyces sp. NPDC017941]|uniref:EF-hand domain-containing protein n=1 Tax=Streptomyces sp. NPDC017941 TaxID=3365018 RepID=UPI00379050BC
MPDRQLTEAPKARVFAMLDMDGDGVASRHDYFVRIERTVKAFGRADDDPLVLAAYARGERAWAAMDADGDGIMTFDEYAAWVDAEKFDTICKYALSALFDLADTDQDDHLNRSEFTLLREALGNQVGKSDTAFAALDADNDGRVGRDEYLAAIRAYVTGEGSPMGEALY